MSVLEKFASEGIIPDLIDQVPGQQLKVTYASGVSVEGIELTPKSVKDEPKVEWEAVEGDFYTLLMTGKYFSNTFSVVIMISIDFNQIPMLHHEKIPNFVKFVIGWLLTFLEVKQTPVKLNGNTLVPDLQLDLVFTAMSF